MSWSEKRAAEWLTTTDEGVSYCLLCGRHRQIEESCPAGGQIRGACRFHEQRLARALDEAVARGAELCAERISKRWDLPVGEILEGGCRTIASQHKPEPPE